MDDNNNSMTLATSVVVLSGLSFFFYWVLWIIVSLSLSNEESLSLSMKLLSTTFSCRHKKLHAVRMKLPWGRGLNKSNEERNN